jgi:predicted dehydrogenase
MKKLKTAILGTGFMGRVHTEAVRRLGNIEVVGVAGSTFERARKFADDLGIEHATGNYRDLLANPEVSAVHICAPNSLHFAMAKAAMEAGKHVLCEKPLASTIAEAKIMIALAKESKLANCTLYNVRGYPQVQQMRRMCEAGEFGDIRVVQGTYSQDWLSCDTDWNWRIESGPSRTFADIGTHWCDLAEYITGLRITSLCADLQTFLKTRRKPKGSVETFTGKTLQPDEYQEVPVKTEDFGAMIFQMGEISKGSMTVSQISVGRKNRLFLEVYGTKSSAVWNAERPDELWIGHRDLPNQVLIKDPSLLM